ncbi:MAG: hypothetical protein Q8P41_26320 [Pseudomonadota bacterium]|nr:hypothetical protein [Pseudomonadota bacterium]
MTVRERKVGVEIGARACLEHIFDWYRGMVSPTTGKFVYLYDPVRDEVVVDGEPIRNIATPADVARLSRFLGRWELRTVVERTIVYWESMLTAKGDALVFDDALVGKPTGIAHSAFLILSMLEAELPRKEHDVRRLAEGILRQQRADGSLKVWFGDRPDEGLEFYPGEALLALLRVYEALGDARCLVAAERGFDFYRARYARMGVSPTLLVFFANWQSQYGARLYQHAGSEALRGRVASFLYELHDRILAEGFYDRVAAEPGWQACVEVACGLEGIAAAQALASQEGDRTRAERYAEAARVACAFLVHAQRLHHASARERGGFGQTLADRLQRIDVTGHASNGLLRAVEAGLVR